MRTLNVWNMLYLLRNEMTASNQRYPVKIAAVCCRLFVLLFLAIMWPGSAVQAQFNQGQNLNYRDFQSKNYYFGITLGYNQSDFRIYHSKDFIRNDSFARAESITGPGFNLGIVSNLRIGEFFDIRFLPTLSFVERNIRYTSPGESGRIFQRPIESVLVEMPFHVRYKSATYHDFRLFVIAGVKYSFDVASDSRTRQAAGIVKIAPTDFQVEYGAGIQFFFPYFIFSPEFKVSQGLNNVLIFNNKLEQSNVLEKVLSRTFTISLHFEG
ncbi:MAG: PorT family protein [Saprospiraceae bacterium]|nr:PorT family protein [Saprospiraceae bacterium]MCB9354483.1 PorT family protein [Lewinellaceae bacterium]